MRYLIFDIECCDGRHICEFGYVITNDKFEVLDKQVMTINPEKPFKLTGRKNQDDLVLFFSEETYYNSPTFPDFYDKIKSLIESPDQLVIGHAIGNDAVFLRTACKRYKLDPLNFSFADSQKMYSEFANDKKQISLENAEAVFDLDKPQYLHKSDDDALLTIQLVQNMCRRLDLPLNDLISLCPTACGSSHNFNIMYTGNSLKDMMAALDKNVNSLSQKKKKQCVRSFAEKVKPDEKIIHSKLTDKKLCFSAQFEKECVKETLKLIQLLANHGCVYNSKVSENDFYVPSAKELESTEIEKNTRYYSARLSDDGRKVELLLYDDLLSVLGITKEELDLMEMPKAADRNKQKAKQASCNSSEESKTTLGDILKARGLDLSGIYSTEK